MKSLSKNIYIIFFLVILSPYVALCDEISIKKIDFDNDDNLSIYVDKKSEFKTYSLNSPDRLVVDIKSATIEENILKKDFPPFVMAIRKNRNGDMLRIVFDLKQKISVKRAAFQKNKNEELGKIFIVTSLDSKASQAFTNNTKDGKKYVIKEEITKMPIIVIDAGHGGKDPGTIGDYARTKEKNITLSYARELAKHLRNTQNYKIYLTRDSDIFIPLQDRVAKARKLNADLFISIHADSALDGDTKGLSIYTLSEKSSDKQAELLAQKENRSDIIAGLNFEDTSGDILKTLIDLSQRSSMNSSSHFANLAIKSIQENDINILQNTHRFAGFVVLTAPDMTSILIELGYLSNRKEEAQLNSLTHKRNIIKALVDAIDEYFKMGKINKKSIVQKK